MDVWFRRAQNCLLGLFIELCGLLIPFSFQALFSHVSPREDPSRFYSSGPAEVTFASLRPKSRDQVPSVLPSSSTLGFFTSGYTAVLRITRNFLKISMPSLGDATVLLWSRMTFPRRRVAVWSPNIKVKFKMYLRLFSSVL